MLQLVWDPVNLRAVATLLYELPNDTGRLDGVAYPPRELTRAVEPYPAKGATDIPRDVVLSWKPGLFANKHDIYFGTNFNDVDQATTTAPVGIYKGRIDPDSYDPVGLLVFGTTYYWRIDEVNAPPDLTVYKGQVWQFMVETFAYPIPSDKIIATASSSLSANTGPENTVNGSGLD